jgi:hypothetical protein
MTTQDQGWEESTGLGLLVIQIEKNKAFSVFSFSIFSAFCGKSQIH